MYDLGILLIGASGNFEDHHFFPASYPTVVSVASVDLPTGDHSGFSTYNSQVELSAPGKDILSTFPNNEYLILSGTSIAAPHVASVAGLLWMYFPLCTNAQIRNALLQTAYDKDGICDEKTGFGLVQALDAYESLAQGYSTIGAISPVGGCDQLIPPCKTDSDCQDEDPCTEDTCNVLLGTCEHKIKSCKDCGKESLVIRIKTDKFPEDTSWKLYKKSKLIAKGDTSYIEPRKMYEHQVCLDSSTWYKFEIFDRFGDGICCYKGEGYYELIFNDVTDRKNGDFGFSEIHNFVIAAIDCRRPRVPCKRKAQCCSGKCNKRKKHCK